MEKSLREPADILIAISTIFRTSRVRKDYTRLKFPQHIGSMDYVFTIIRLLLENWTILMALWWSAQKMKWSRDCVSNVEVGWTKYHFTVVLTVCSFLLPHQHNNPIPVDSNFMKCSGSGGHFRPYLPLQSWYAIDYFCTVFPQDSLMTRRARKHRITSNARAWIVALFCTGLRSETMIPSVVRRAN